MSRHVERRQVVQRDIVHRSLVLQEVFDAFNVVALSRHVERGQPVLKRDGEIIYLEINMELKEKYCDFEEADGSLLTTLTC